MKNLSDIPSAHYPYHLSWEEIQHPELLLHQFLIRWDLSMCRVLLRKIELRYDGKIVPSEDKSEINLFLHDLVRLLEAIYLINYCNER